MNSTVRSLSVWLVLAWAGASLSHGQESKAMEPSSSPPKLDETKAADIRDGTAEEQRRWESKAIEYLLAEVRQNPALHVLDRGVEPLTPETFDRKGRRRFGFVRFRGRLEYLRASPDAEDVHRGRVLIHEKPPRRRVVFVTPQLPVAKDTSKPVPSLTVIKEGWVRGRGVYVKRYRDGTAGDREVPALLVVASRIERDYATKPVTSLDDVGLEAIDDDPGDRSPEQLQKLFAVHSLPLFRLVKFAATCDRGKLVRNELGGIEELIEKRREQRGRYFAGRGTLALDLLHVGEGRCEANDAGVEEYLTGWIVTDREQLFQFVAPATVARGLEARERLRYEGFFFKLRAYYSRDGRTRIAPVFVLAALERADS